MMKYLSDKEQQTFLSCSNIDNLKIGSKLNKFLELKKITIKDVSKVFNNDYGFMLTNGKYTAISSVNLLVDEKLIIEIIITDLFSDY